MEFRNRDLERPCPTLWAGAQADGNDQGAESGFETSSLGRPQHTAGSPRPGGRGGGLPGCAHPFHEQAPIPRYSAIWLRLKQKFEERSPIVVEPDGV
jgi:hypothetical protein